MPDKDLITQHILRYYNEMPEFLFAGSPDVGVFRHKQNGKWYAVFMRVPWKKFGIEREGETEIVNLKCPPELAYALRDGKTVFPAYHMNKEHWISLALDCGKAKEEILSLIDLSYALTISRQKCPNDQKPKN